MHADEAKKNRWTPASFPAIRRCVLISTEIMQAALFASMKPMPPMSQARL